MEKKAKNMKIISIASKVFKAMEDESEAILADTEEVVKKHFPARYVKAALKKIESKLSDNGIEACFDKEVSKEALKKTASVKPSARELHEAIDEISKAAVAEFEDMLADGEEVVNKVIGRFASKDRKEVEAKLKSVVERRMHKIGVYCKFNRVNYDPKESLKKMLSDIIAKRKEAHKAKEAAKEARKEKIASAVKKAMEKKASKKETVDKKAAVKKAVDRARKSRLGKK